METVVAFNTELSGLYESKPPISKAKMTSITRSAMKAIKFYKHVVQSVEKFILKCKQEYKIPGLYVIDSIVRQSRHQFGTEKDVFAPRFARNMQQTFANLFQCSPEDKSKIIRVLNLWQKNNVFAPEVIQPLFDLADPNHPIYQNQNSSQDTNNISNGLLSSITQESPAPNMMDDGHTMSSDMSGPVTMPTANLDSSTIRQLQQLQQFLLRQTNSEPVASTSTNAAMAQESVKFNKKLLDYDYDDEEDDDKNQSPRQSQQQQQTSALDHNNISQLLNDPNVLRHLQNFQKFQQQEEKQSKLAEMRIQEEAFEKHLATVLKKLPFANECDLSRQDRNDQIYGIQNANLTAILQQQQQQQQQQQSGIGMMSNAIDQLDPEVELVSDDGKVEVINLDGNSRSPSIDRDRYGKRRRSRSRSRDRSGRDRRRRSRSRSPRSRRRGSSRDRDRGKDKEKERERKRKGLPDIKRDHLSVCSTTLWIGHLSKLVQQEELSDTFAKYGDVVSIDVIHPRGCAFIVMHRRQDAFKAIAGLKNYKFHGRAITISWAAGKGVKSKEWKDYWDLELGVSYIPWSKLSESTDFEQLEEGGMFDEDTMPTWMQEKLKAQSQKKDQSQAPAAAGQIPSIAMFSMDTSQPPPNTAQPLMPGVPPMVPPFQMGSVPRFMPPMMPPGLGIPLGVPPPMNGQMMMPQAGMVPGIPPPIGLDKPPPSNSAYMGFFPPIPQMPPIPATATGPSSQPSASGGDDHMDIEMEDEAPSKTPQSSAQNIVSPLGLFNRPPPQLFGSNALAHGNQSTSKALDEFGNNDRQSKEQRQERSLSRDRSIGSYDRDREYRGRGREKEKDNRNRGGNRDRRNDYSNERGGDRNSRWPDNRGRSRDNEPNRGRQNSRDRRSRDRNDRDKSLQDRLRDLANDGGNRSETGDFNSLRNDLSQRNNMPWRDGPPPAQHQGNFGNSFLEQPSRRPLNTGATLPALEDIRIGPIPLESLRGPPVGPLLGNKAHHGRGFDYNRGSDEFDRRQGPGNPPGREFYGPNRFAPPGVNGPPIGMIRGNLPQFGPRNNTPMFMWGPRAGLNNTERPFFDHEGGNTDGNFNRNDRMRGNGPNVDGRNRGTTRPNWKENENNQTNKSRISRGLDGQKDNRKSSRWGNNSPKSTVSEESWDADASNSPKKQNRTKPGDISNDKKSKDTVKTNQPQNESIDDSNKNDVSETQTKDDKQKSSSAPQEQEQQQQQQLQPDTNKSHNLESSNKNSNQNKMPSETNISEKKGATNSTTTSSTSNNTNNSSNNNNNQQRDNNTTPLYDEPAEERSYPAKNQQSSTITTATTVTTTSTATKELPAITESSGSNKNTNNSTNAASVVESTAESNTPATDTQPAD